MARTFVDEIVQTSQTTGIGTYFLDDGGKGSYRTFRQGYGDGDAPEYVVRNPKNTKWEHHRGATLIYGTPDKLTRSVLKSTNGDAPVAWTSDDMPLTIYVPSSADVLEGAITGWLGTAKHALLAAGASWMDITLGLAVAWRDKLYIGGGVNAEKGRYEATPGVYVSSPRRPTLATGTTGLVVTANHIGWRLTFDTAAASRVLTLPAIATVDKGYTVSGLGLSAANGVVITPAAGEVVDFGNAGAPLVIPGRIPFDLWSDGIQWRTNYVTQTLFTTGDIKLTLKTVADSGWALFNDGTIGSASSGATYAAADAQALFYFMYSGFSDALAPVTGGRGASKEADWAANKKIKLLTVLGRALALSGAGSGLTARTLGDIVGAEKHTLTEAENTVKAAGTSGSGGGSPVPAFGVGAAAAFDIMNPTFYVNAMIKL